MRIGMLTLAVAGILVLSLPQMAFAAPGYEKVAGAADTGGQKGVGKYGMLPVYGKDIKDGTYDIDSESSSSFFKMQNAKLTVKDGALSIQMQISSTSYEYIYLGTGEEAAKAPLEDYIAPDVKDGISTFTFPIDALDQAMDCAAYSKAKKKWYDRKILFDASSLPAEALLITLPDYDRIEDAIALYDETNGTDSANELAGSAKDGSTEGVNGSTAGSGTAGADGIAGAVEEDPDADNGSGEPTEIDMEDGTYSIQVNMTGGSGRASVSSPTWLIVKDHKAYARLLWSSSYYDYMIVGGKKYLNESTDGGNSTFTIPISTMDVPIQVIGDTTAMGDPVEIEYKLTFYEDSIGGKSQIPQEAAIDVLIIAAIIIVVGGILNYFVKKRRKH